MLKSKFWLGYIVVFLFLMAGILVAHKDRFLFNLLSQQGQIEPAMMTGLYDKTARAAIYNNISMTLPSYLAEVPVKAVLGDSSEPKVIEVDLTNQRLYAKQGGRRVYEFPVSTGLWGRTPTGTFNIWTKLRYTRMKGGSQALRTYYNLPNVPYTMFFYNTNIPKMQGYGIHGAYWHNNFGHPMSHGCVNMKPAEAGLLYNWADISTPIIIYGVAPLS